MATAEGVVSFLLEKLNLLLREERDLSIWVDIWVDNEVTEIQDVFMRMRFFLRDGDARAQTSQTVKYWVEQVREIAYDVEDIIDDLMLNLFRLQQKQERQHHGVFQFLAGSLFSMQTLRMRHQYSLSISNVLTKLRGVLQQQSQLQLTEINEAGSSSIAADNQWISLRMGSLFMEPSDLVYIEHARDQIISWLLKRDSWTVAVVGMAGLGKTTLVKQVCNCDHVQRYFDFDAWVTVSNRFSVTEILLTLLKQFHWQPHVFPQKEDVSYRTQLAALLREYLDRRRYLIVLDDVWSIDVWDVLKYILPDGRNGGRVIITTRMSEVARSTFGPVYNIQPLPAEEAWKLFCMRAFHPSGECPLQLENLSQKIVNRCGGLPLAIVATAGFFSLKRKNANEWQMYLENLNIEFGTNPYFTTLLKSLRLSYDDLPYYLKSCFLYLSIFPDDVPISVTKLIRLWIAEGFVQGKQNMTAEEVGEVNVNQLVNRSILEAVEFNVSGRLKSCRVHEIVRDMIDSLVREENFFSTSVGGSDVKLDSRTRRLSIHDSPSSWITKLEGYTPHLRSLIMFGGENFLGRSLLRAVSKLRFLSVLDLADTMSLTSLPANIGNLLLLRYLSLRNTKIKTLPDSLGNLKHMETLDLRGTDVSVLSSWILRLKKLRHLLVYRHNKNVASAVPSSRMEGVVVPNGIGNLEDLQRLAYIQVGGEVIEELSKLKQMRSLRIRILEAEDGRKVCSSIQQMNRLLSFTAISVDDDGMTPLDLSEMTRPPTLLESLNLTGGLKELPRWIASLKNLVRLHLLESRLKSDPLAILQSLPNLVVLALIRAYDGQELHCNEGFPKLKVLKLVKLHALVSLQADAHALQSLQELHITGCPELKNVSFAIEGMENTHLYLDCVPEEVKNALYAYRKGDTADIPLLPSNSRGEAMIS